MGKHSHLVELRLNLDEAITYGTRSEALRLAKKYLLEALKKKLPAEAEYFSGQVKLIKEDFSGAIEHFDRAIKLNPIDGASYNDRALCMVELGIIDQALRYFDKGIEVEPDYATIYHNKGWLLNNIGRSTEAIIYFKKALELEPDRAVTYDNLADALYNLEDYRGACEAYKMVIRLLKPGKCKGIKKEIEKKIESLEREHGHS
jgi:tetratricopeptide (TPR) repeat protein